MLKNSLNGAKMMLPSSFIERTLMRHEDRGKVVSIILLTSLFTILPVGYHMVVLNVPDDVIQQSLSDSLFNTFGVILSRNAKDILWAILVSCQSLGALVGCFMVTPLLRRFGVKSALMMVNNVLLLLGSLSMLIAFLLDFAPLLIIGRLLIGVFTGIACALLPLFVQQVAPKQIKSSLSCFVHISVCFGAAVSAVLSLNFLLGGQHTWGWLLFAPAILGAIQILVNLYVPETPNYYLQNGFYIQAIESIKFYYDISYDDDDEAIQEYWDMVPEMPNQMGFVEASMSSTIRKGALLGVIVSASQVFSGSVASISYSTSMFEAVSFTKVLIPFLPALGAVFSIILTVPALQLVETTSRRSLLLSTLSLCLVADCLLLIFSLLSMEGWWASWLYLVAFFIYGLGYNLGVGPLAYFIPAELVPAEAAGASLGVAVAVNWLCSMISTLVYYPLNESVGGWSYLLFIMPTSLFLLVLYFFLPETRYHYRADPTEDRLLVDLGPPSPYGTFADEVDDLF
uniref:MFS domain-containing protein n=1 Tax=Haemonchus contortus TaxID=6289 RepID=A0A7I4YPX1_HAECO